MVRSSTGVQKSGHPCRCGASRVWVRICLIVTCVLCNPRGSNAWGWFMLGNWSTTNFSLPCDAAYCVNLPFANASMPLTLHRCLGVSFWEEQFTYDGKTVVMHSSMGVGFCLDVVGDSNQVGLAGCNPSSQSQQWSINGSKVRNGQGLFLMVPAPLVRPFGPNVGLLVGAQLNQSFLSDWTIMDSSLLQSFKPPLPDSQSSNLVRNGQFLQNWAGEQAEGSPGDMTLICRWNIVGDSKTFLVRENIGWSVNWNVKPGAISQVVPTHSGLAHILRFDVKGNSTCSVDSPSSKRLLVSLIPSSSTATTFNVSAAAAASWGAQEVRFLAQDSIVNLTFTSLDVDGSACWGLVIGNVEVSLDIGSLQTSSSGSNLRIKVVLLSVLAAVLGSVAMVAVVLYFLASRNGKLFCDLGPRLGVPASMSGRLQRRMRRFAYADLHAITEGFSRKSLIGAGGYANVYVGKSSDGYMLAIKKAFKLQPDAQFNHEVDMLDRVHHRRLVPFLGYCDDNGEEQILVFEYMSNGSLHHHLHDPHVSPLSFDKRVKIAQDVAQGLEYLHHGANPPIIHRDVKSGNILLDDNFSAKVADFGIFKQGHEDTSRNLSIETNVKGSYGYMDPRQIDSGTISTKSDVYSFGVVLLELVTGRKAIADGSLLSDWAKLFYDKDVGRLTDMVDPRIAKCVDPLHLQLLVYTAQQCLLPDREDRPTMLEVVSMLGEESTRSCRGGFTPLSMDTSSSLTRSQSRRKRGKSRSKREEREEVEIEDTARFLQSRESESSGGLENWIDIREAG